jgi:hypothetical protein
VVNCPGYHEGNKVWVYRPTRTKGKSPKLQSSWEGLYKVVAWINDVVYRIQWNPRSRLTVVQLDQLTLYQEPLEKSGLKEDTVGAVGK